MSAPDTNLEKQRRRHRPALWGMWAGLVFASVLLLAFLLWVAFLGGTPEGADTQIEVLPGGAVDTQPAD